MSSIEGGHAVMEQQKANIGLCIGIILGLLGVSMLIGFPLFSEKEPVMLSSMKDDKIHQIEEDEPAIPDDGVSRNESPISPPSKVASKTLDQTASSPRDETADTIDVKTPEQEPKQPENRMDDDEYEQMLNEQFEAEALETFPLYTVDTYDPLFPNQYGPPRGEVWVRIKPEASREAKDIMAQIADLYKISTYYEAPVKVMNWVGGRPHMQFEYSFEEKAMEGEEAIN